MCVLIYLGTYALVSSHFCAWCNSGLLQNGTKDLSCPVSCLQLWRGTPRSGLFSLVKFSPHLLSMPISGISLNTGILVASFVQDCVWCLLWHGCQKSCLTSMRWSSFFLLVSKSCLEIMALFYREILYLPGRVHTSCPGRWFDQIQSQLQDLWREGIFASLGGADGRHEIVHTGIYRRVKTVQVYMIPPPSSSIPRSI